MIPGGGRGCEVAEYMKKVKEIVKASEFSEREV